MRNTLLILSMISMVLGMYSTIVCNIHWAVGMYFVSLITYLQSKEYDTVIRLSDDSKLSKSHKPVSSDDLIIIIGNLIDNSLEAFQNTLVTNRKINVKIYEDDTQIKIGVSDNAGGIDPSIKSRMFKRGVSSKKGEGRGTGLSLVNEIVNMYNGEKQVQSSTHNTYIEVTLKKVK